MNEKMRTMHIWEKDDLLGDSDLDHVRELPRFKEIAAKL